MSIFSDTMRQSISIYRKMLRKYLAQAERVTKLNQFNLKDQSLYEDEVALYNTGYAIVQDIQSNLNKRTSGYYAYSGVGNFAQHLKSFLDTYEIENNRVLHRSQKASRALIEAIQLLNVSTSNLTEETAEKLYNCNKLIAKFGSEEQQELHRSTLQTTVHEHPEKNSAFYRSLLNNFQECLNSPETETEIAA